MIGRWRSIHHSRHAFGDGVHDQSQKPLSGDLTLIQIRFPIVKELSPFYLWLRAVDD